MKNAQSVLLANTLPQNKKGRDMYQVKKVLNHNAVIGISTEANQEFLILGKGIGFGKKENQMIETGSSDKIYYLQPIEQKTQMTN